MAAAAAAAKSLQLCPTLCDPIDFSPPGSPSLGFSRQEHWSGLSFPSPQVSCLNRICQDLGRYENFALKKSGLSQATEKCTGVVEAESSYCAVVPQGNPLIN